MAMEGVARMPEGAQKQQFLYDIYRKEADDHMARQQYAKALKSFNLAIKLSPHVKAALIGRSRCQLHLGKNFRAMQDVERALTIDASDLDAVHQKAEILYLSGNYQLASVYYKKGAKLDPDAPRFQQGIARAHEALQRFGGGMVSKNKLSAVGDLSFFLNNNKRRHTDLELDTGKGQASGRELELPTPGFQARHRCPLVRISRKPRFPQLATFQTEDLGEAGGLAGLDAVLAEEANEADAAQPGGAGEGARGGGQPDEDTMRKILGELYGDRKYLQRLQADLPRERGTRSEVGRLAREGTDFLRERSVLWGRRSLQNPLVLPPPPEPLPKLALHRHHREITLVRLCGTIPPMSRGRPIAHPY